MKMPSGILLPDFYHYCKLYLPPKFDIDSSLRVAVKFVMGCLGVFISQQDLTNSDPDGETKFNWANQLINEKVSKLKEAGI